MLKTEVPTFFLAGEKVLFVSVTCGLSDLDVGTFNMTDTL